MATYLSNLLKYLPWLDSLESSEPVNNLLFNCVRVPAAQLRRRWQVYHAPSYTCPLISFCPIVMTVHDISYLAHPEWYPYKTGVVRVAYYRACLRRADRIVVPSRFSKQEIVRLFPALEGRIRIIPMGVSDFFSPAPDLAVVVTRELNLPSRFILHVGDLHFSSQSVAAEAGSRAGGFAARPGGKAPGKGFDSRGISAFHRHFDG